MSVLKATPDLIDANDADEFLDAPVPPSKRMTEDEFVAWCAENAEIRAEWADGEVIMMAPASYAHNDLGGWLYMLLRLFVERRDLGKVIGPEFMVRFATQRRRRVPDIHFISKARLDILQPNHAEGAPDLLIELVSPESESRDWRVKYHEYERAGVREYWVIDPNSNHLEAYQLLEQAGQSSYQRIEEKEDRVASTVLPGLYIRPSWLWQENLPDVIGILRELGVQFT